MPDFDVIHRSNISHEETLTARFVWSYEIVQCYGPFMLIENLCSKSWMCLMDVKIAVGDHE